MKRSGGGNRLLSLRRTSSARWAGPASSGTGTLELGATEFAFSLKTRVGDGPATNPEELLGAAHAGCFAMSLANECENNGTPAESLQVKATVHLVQQSDGFRIPRVDLHVTGRVPGVDAARFAQLATVAEAGCPVSRLFDAEIVLTAELEKA